MHSLSHVRVGPVAQSVAMPTSNQAVGSTIMAQSHIFVEIDQEIKKCFMCFPMYH